MLSLYHSAAFGSKESEAREVRSQKKERCENKLQVIYDPNDFNDRILLGLKGTINMALCS